MDNNFNVRARFRSILQKKTLESEDVGGFLLGLTKKQRELLSIGGISLFVNVLDITSPKEIVRALDAVNRKAEAPS